MQKIGRKEERGGHFRKEGEIVKGGLIYLGFAINYNYLIAIGLPILCNLTLNKKKE